MKKLFLTTAYLLSGLAAFAQIPNSGFETWSTSSGYNMPGDWDNLNPLTSALSIYTCTKGTPGYGGSSYIQLTSKNVATVGVVPGVAVSGVINTTTYMPQSGFAFSARPASLTGAWQYMAYGSDAGHIIVYLSKWNTTTSSRDTVAYTDHTLSGMVMSWATFSIPLTYKSSATPDSAIIVLSSSGTSPVNNSYLYVDDLAFTGTAPSSIANTVKAVESISIYPNPAGLISTLELSTTQPGSGMLTITDVTGRIVNVQNIVATKGRNSYNLPTSALSKGHYIVSVVLNEERYAQTLVIE